MRAAHRVKTKCRICQRRMPHGGKAGRPLAAHPECERVVQVHILDKLPKRVPFIPTEETKAKLSAQPLTRQWLDRPLPPERCEYCPDFHADPAQVAVCRVRFMKAQQHVRDAR